MEDFGVINYITYLLGTIMIILLPGPNSLYVLSLSAQHGTKQGWSAALGIFIGDAILMILTALGAASVLITYPFLFKTIKYIGALYLVYIGFKLIQGSVRLWRDNINLNKEGPQKQSDSAIHKIEKIINKIPAKKSIHCRQAFKKALVLSLLNPKAILFFLSFFVQFVNPQYSNPIIPFLILAVTLQICSFSYLALLIYTGSRLAETFRKRKKISAISSGGVGAGFIVFALKLAAATV